MLEEHLGGHGGLTHLDEGALSWLKNLGNSSFLDIGCGPGGMVQLAESMEFKVLGIDGDYTLERYNPDRFIIHDFAKAPIEINEIYDIGWSVEFVEHVYEEFIPNYMATMQAAKHFVLSHAPKGAPGYHHVNCQDSQYWVDRMKQYGFKYDSQMTKRLKQVTTMGFDGKKKHRFIKKTGLFFINEKL